MLILFILLVNSSLSPHSATTVAGSEESVERSLNELIEFDRLHEMDREFPPNNGMDLDVVAVKPCVAVCGVANVIDPVVCAGSVVDCCDQSKGVVAVGGPVESRSWGSRILVPRQ